jgi:hypothetical protein
MHDENMDKTACFRLPIVASDNQLAEQKEIRYAIQIGEEVFQGPNLQNQQFSNISYLYLCHPCQFGD